MGKEIWDGQAFIFDRNPDSTYEEAKERLIIMLNSEEEMKTIFDSLSNI